VKRAALVTVLVLGVLVLPARAAGEPAIGRTCNGLANCAPWFTVPVKLDWTVVAGDPIGGCVDRTITSDTAGTEFGCIADDADPNTPPVTSEVTIKLDQTPPTVADALPERPPDHAGWYTGPVSFTIAGADATSGIDRCDPVSYAGPDDAGAVVLGTCRDRAGHVASRAFPLRYDATPPDTSGVSVDTGDRRVRLHWPPAATATVVRSPGVGEEPSTALSAAAGGMTDLRVRNGVAYRYLVTLADEAGNAASRDLVAVPGPRLLAPAKRAQVTAPPLLRWTPVRGARYYNVQIFRGRHKVLSAWPRRPSLQLKETWRFRGRERHLRAGRYRWFVWPGEGPREDNEYGKRIGARSFVVAP
jgi:hypothetical protein